MSSETLDEIRATEEWKDCITTLAAFKADDVSVEFVLVALRALIAAERADAERAAEKRHHTEACESCAVTESDLIKQRERADQYERDWYDKKADFEKDTRAAIEQATRPYRMAIARWFASRSVNFDNVPRPGPTHLKQRLSAEDEMRSLITDADLDAARKEDGRE